MLILLKDLLFADDSESSKLPPPERYATDHGRGAGVGRGEDGVGTGVM
jgi:hypothetical protein